MKINQIKLTSAFSALRSSINSNNDDSHNLLNDNKSKKLISGTAHRIYD